MSGQKATVQVIGVDVGIANFLTSSDGRHYGTFHGKLRERQKRDREKRRRKGKLRACLEKKGVKKLPSTSSKSGQRLMRHVRQEINRAVNICLDEHPEAQIAYEQLSVASMKYKARAMNAYLRASNLAHIPKKLSWETTKRGMAASSVKSAYSSQECGVCHYPDRANRPNQQTFCCVVCRYSTHADHNAATNLAQRWDDKEQRSARLHNMSYIRQPCNLRSAHCTHVERSTRSFRTISCCGVGMKGMKGRRSRNLLPRESESRYRAIGESCWYANRY